jgi:crotonobetainyl-CoA:carnitine CoA-transferase CaiB-like acyl-CoA transferase
VRCSVSTLAKGLELAGASVDEGGMSAFEGVKVLDGSRGLAGSMAAMHLADFGAKVLRIEPPTGNRSSDSPGAIGWNRNKHIYPLDLATKDDRARFDALLGGADVLIVDHGPAALASLGLEGAALTAAHPRLIHLWTPPFGTTGAWSDLPPHNGMLMGLSGAAFRQGSYTNQPVWHVAPIVHYAQTLLAAAAAGAALYERASTGRGQTVVVSGLHAIAEVACPIGQVGASSFPRGSPIGGSLGYRLYQCGDGGWLFLGALFSHFFYRALEALDLLGGDSYDFGDAIERKLLSGPRDHWLSLLRAKEVPCGPVERREDWLRSEIIQANGLAAALDHPAVGPVEMPGVSAKLERTPGSVRHFARPATGEQIAAFAGAPRSTSAATWRKPSPLDGVRVLDLGTVIAGTYAASILANFGADVVKVEPAEGDPFRSGGPGFINYNRGKRGLGLNLKAPSGRALFLDLARGADVVLDNYRLGVRERLGVEYSALAEANPRIISCSANTYGSQGSEARQPGFDAVLQARSGMMAAQGGEGGEPVFHAIPINDVATAALTSFAIIAALYARERTGEGQNIETSLAAASIAFQFGELVAYEGRPRAPQGSCDCIGFTALDRYYRCRDGWLTLACTGVEHFEALARSVGDAEWLAQWPGEAVLDEPRDGALAGAIASALGALERDSVIEVLTGSGVPCAPVLRGDEAQRTEFFWDNGYYQLYAHPYGGELVGGRGFAEFNGKPAAFDRLHPELGEHGVEVLLDYGIPRDRIVELARAGVIFRG